MAIIFFDTETTGLSYNNHSVLNFACILREDDGTEHTIERFYYPDPLKEVDYHAINVNKLTDRNIKKLRGACSYPDYFKDDIEMETVFEGGIGLMVGHNITFDINFILAAFSGNDKVRKTFNGAKKFCTMRENKRDGKPLKLSVVCDLTYNIDIDSKNYHNALWDTIAAKEIYDRMKTPKDRRSGGR
jgi:DNA polymerase III alpha subunit (gram-positive type)